MPTVLRVGPYRFFFFSNERGEPPHVHVERDDAYAKFWLEPVQLVRNVRFGSHELGELSRIVQDNAGRFLERWHEYFRD